jgi:putative ABC transport system ATP-binding protein
VLLVLTTTVFAMLRVEGLAKHYLSGDRRQTIFEDLSLHLAPAEVVALIGASGSGKTTLLNLLSGIDAPDSGRVLLEGDDIHAQGEPAITLLRRNKLGFVFQFFNLIPTLTVAENIALPMELTGFAAADIEQRVKNLLAQIGLPGTGRRYPETLSGGEQQRTAIARAVAHHPRLLLADEPTGNLDEDTGRSIIRLIHDIAREEKTTMLIVTHSAEVARMADRVVTLQHGRLVDA